MGSTSAAGFDGRRELVAREVPDPYDGKHLTVVVNVRESPLEHLLNRGVINDGQKAAGDRFRKLYERSVVGGAKAFDYRRPKVDGGQIYDPMPSSMGEAFKALAWVRSVVGERDYWLLVKVAAEGQSIGEATGNGAKPVRLYWGHRFRDALALLADRWGFGGPLDQVTPRA